MLTIIIIILVIVLIPPILFFGLVGLTLAIWCGRRIGPYFVNLGRWLSNWHNCLPCSCMGCTTFILILVATAFILPSSLRLPLVLLVVFAVLLALLFTTPVWIARVFSWAWPRFRQWFWQFPPRLGDLLWKRLPDMVERRMPGGPQAGQGKSTRKPVAGPESTTAEATTEPQTQAMPPEKHSWLDMAWLWGILWGKPQKPVRKKPTVASPASAAGAAQPKPLASVQPSGKRSRFSVSSLWSMLWGKPQQPVKKKPKAGAVLSETQSQVVVSIPEKTKAGVAAKPRTGLRPLTWRLGVLVSSMRRRMQRMWGKPAPPGKNTMKAQSKPNTPATATAEPSKVRGGPTAAVNFVRKRFWLAIFWVVEKVRTGVNFMLRLLHLNGRKK